LYTRLACLNRGLREFVFTEQATWKAWCSESLCVRAPSAVPSTLVRRRTHSAALVVCTCSGTTVSHATAGFEADLSAGVDWMHLYLTRQHARADLVRVRIAHRLRQQQCLGGVGLKQRQTKPRKAVGCSVTCVSCPSCDCAVICLSESSLKSHLLHTHAFSDVVADAWAKASRTWQQ
jgi:hypothetical protein